MQYSRVKLWARNTVSNSRTARRTWGAPWPPAMTASLARIAPNRRAALSPGSSSIASVASCHVARPLSQVVAVEMARGASRCRAFRNARRARCGRCSQGQTGRAACVCVRRAGRAHQKKSLGGCSCSPSLGWNIERVRWKWLAIAACYLAGTAVTWRRKDPGHSQLARLAFGPRKYRSPPNDCFGQEGPALWNHMELHDVG